MAYVLVEARRRGWLVYGQAEVLSCRADIWVSKTGRDPESLHGRWEF